MSWLAAFRRPLGAFAATSLAAVAVGAVVCALSGVPTGAWGRNLAAWATGALAAAALGRWAGPRTLFAVLSLTPLAVGVTLLGAGQEGVHRWVRLGPLFINVAMLVLPAFVVAFAFVAQRMRLWSMAAPITLALLAAQPDASQATALAVAVGVMAFGMRAPSAVFRWGVVLAAAALAGLAWTRPDPLAPVAEVEWVIGLAGQLSPLLAALAVLALVAVTATPVLAARGSAEPGRRAGRALSALFLAWCAAPALGAFPVPLVGVGLSPILGAWLGIGLLAAVMRGDERLSQPAGRTAG